MRYYHGKIMFWVFGVEGVCNPKNLQKTASQKKSEIWLCYVSASKLQYIRA